MKKRIAIVFAIMLTSTVAMATTWLPTQMTDPISGEKVEAMTVASFGSYIYQWPSKFDLVFWPYIDSNFICINPKNGYGAFNNDFDKLTDDEKKVLKEWLAKNYDPSKPPKTTIEKLKWIEKVYEQRKMDDEFWSHFYRVMAYVIGETDPKAGLEYVKKAMPLLEKALAANPEGMARLEVVYLLGEYNRRLGNIEAAKKYFAEVRTIKYKDEQDGGKEKVGHPYFIELIEDREKLMQGGQLQ